MEIVIIYFSYVFDSNFVLCILPSIMQVYFESVYIAITSIKVNILRSILTIMIISIGIMALVGILTAIDSV